MIQLALYSSIANPPRGERLDRCVDETSAEAQLAESCGRNIEKLGWEDTGNDVRPTSFPMCFSQKGSQEYLLLQEVPTSRVQEMICS